MPDWAAQMMGPGGALIVLVVVGRAGFNFFTEMIRKQDEKYDKQVDRLATLHTSTLEHIHAQTLAVSQHTEALKLLSDSIKNCPNAGEKQPANFGVLQAAVNPQ